MVGQILAVPLVTYVAGTQITKPPSYFWLVLVIATVIAFLVGDPKDYMLFKFSDTGVFILLTILTLHLLYIRSKDPLHPVGRYITMALTSGVIFALVAFGTGVKDALSRLAMFQVMLEVGLVFLLVN